VENDLFTFKALNADDDSEVLQLVRLFQRVYGDSFPLAPVYSAKFWKVHAGTRFTSLLAMQGRKVSAHLAIRPDRDNPLHIQIYLPACDPEFIAAGQEHHQQLVNLIKRQAERHGWQMLYCYLINNVQPMRFLAEDLFQTQEVAIWPKSLPELQIGRATGSAEQNSLRRHVIVTQRLLNGASQAGLEETPLYVPEWHRQVCAWLYSNLGLTRLFCTDFDHTRVKQQFLPTFSADRRSIETRTYRQTKVTLSCVEPNLIGDFRQALRQLEQATGYYHYVSVNMQDPATPAFSAALEESGYRFCGVLPFHRGKESIIYCNHAARFFLAEELGASPSALARYIERYSFRDQSRSAWQAPAGARRPFQGVETG